jgi:DNA excision repair protein ERCC-2
LPPKVSVINTILSNLPSPASKLIIVASHIHTCSQLSSLLRQSHPSLPGLILSSKPASFLKKTVNCSSPDKIESKCNNLCNSNSCPYSHTENSELSGILSIADIKEVCENKKICPCFLTQKHLVDAKVVICTQAYLFRKGFDQVKAFAANSVILFEDAINLDNSAIDYLSVNLNLKTLSSALKGIEEITQAIQAIFSPEKPNALTSKDYEKYVNDIKSSQFQEYTKADCFVRNIIGLDQLQSLPIPGNIRQPLHFLKLLKIVIVFLRQYLRNKEPSMLSCSGFLFRLLEKSMVETDTLKFSSLLLSTTVSFLQLSITENLQSLSTVCDFCSFASLTPMLYCIVFEPHPEHASLLQPIIQLSCQSPSAFIRQLLHSFSSAVLFSTSLMPPDVFFKLLGVQGPLLSLPSAESICPLIITRGSDQLFLSTKPDEKTDDGVMRNYGEIILELSDVVPDGIVVFFPEWAVLESYVMKWNESGILYRLLEQKILLIETPGMENRVLASFGNACECGRGAILLALSRGKVANEVHAYGEQIRGSIMFGVPQMDVMSRALKARLMFLKERVGIEESEYLNFDAMRQAVYCLSQGIKAGSKHLIMALADKRFESVLKRERIPAWISEKLKNNISVSTDVAKTFASKFLKTI